LSTLEEDRDTGADKAGPDMPGAGAGRWRARLRAGLGAGLPAVLGAVRRARAGVAGLVVVAGRHRLFAAALGLAVVPRVVVLAGFAPAALFKLCGTPRTWCRIR